MRIHYSQNSLALLKSASTISLMEDEQAKSDKERLAPEADVRPAPKADHPPDPSPTEIPDSQNSGSDNKRKLMLVAAAVVILIGGAGAWWALGHKKSTTKTTTSNNSSQSANQPALVQSGQPDLVAYAFKEKDTSPYTVYWRPAAGADNKRTQALSLDNGVGLSRGDVLGSKVAFNTDKAIYVSSDGGKKYDLVYTLQKDEQITSVKFSSDGGALAVATLPAVNPSTKNSVKSINLTDKQTAALFTSDKLGVFLMNWQRQKQTIIYTEGCTQCDGNTYNEVLVRDLRSNTINKKIALSPDTSKALVAGDVVSNDGTKLIYSTGLVAPGEGLPGAGAPYTVYELDIASGKTTTIATSDSKTNHIFVGYQGASTKPYYTFDKQLYAFDASGDGKWNLFFEGGKSILGVFYVGPPMAVVSVGNDTADFALTFYTSVKTASNTILQGDNNTQIFGVTTK